jgi:hypothetical protein
LGGGGGGVTSGGAIAGGVFVPVVGGGVGLCPEARSGGVAVMGGGVSACVGRGCDVGVWHAATASKLSITAQRTGGSSRGAAG